LLHNFSIILYNTKQVQEVPGGTHKAYFSIAQTSNPTYHMLLMICLGNVSV